MNEEALLWAGVAVGTGLLATEALVFFNLVVKPLINIRRQDREIEALLETGNAGDSRFQETYKRATGNNSNDPIVIFGDPSKRAY